MASDARAMARIFLRIDLVPKGRIGPGKIALLEQIALAGSISAAGRALGMSYRRAWLLVECQCRGALAVIPKQELLFCQNRLLSLSANHASAAALSNPETVAGLPSMTLYNSIVALRMPESKSFARAPFRTCISIASAMRS